MLVIMQTNPIISNNNVMLEVNGDRSSILTLLVRSLQCINYPKKFKHYKQS
ncbi:MAG: hypothetical protein V7L20_09055 [Nostoc sp.]